MKIEKDGEDVTNSFFLEGGMGISRTVSEPSRLASDLS